MGDLFPGEEFGGGDFELVGAKGAGVLSEVNLDEFIAGVGRGGQESDFVEFGLHAELFGEFPMGAVEVVLAAIHMPGRAAVPNPGVDIFPRSPFLQKNFPGGILQNDVSRPMAQPALMDD
jgi:hypothetical protein